MKKIDNFKVYFSNILEYKYHLNKKQIDLYWENKDKEINFQNKKLIGSIVGLVELIGAGTCGYISNEKDINLAIPIILLGSTGFLTAKISSIIKNPYTNKNKVLEKDYYIEKEKFNKSK